MLDETSLHGGRGSALSTSAPYQNSVQESDCNSGSLPETLVKESSREPGQMSLLNDQSLRQSMTLWLLFWPRDSDPDVDQGSFSLLPACSTLCVCLLPRSPHQPWAVCSAQIPGSAEGLRSC